MAEPILADLPSLETPFSCYQMVLHIWASDLRDAYTQQVFLTCLLDCQDVMSLCKV